MIPQKPKSKRECKEWKDLKDGEDAFFLSSPVLQDKKRPGDDGGDSCTTT